MASLSRREPLCATRPAAVLWALAHLPRPRRAVPWNVACVGPPRRPNHGRSRSPRPSLRVPRPERSSAAAPPRDRVPTRSAPRLMLHSVDLEDVAPLSGEPQPTLLHPLGEERDPLDVVTDHLRGVRCERAVEAASVCLAATARAVGCRAAIAHLWDARARSFVIVYAAGPNAPRLLNARHGAGDALLAEGLAKRAPRVVNYEGTRPALSRHAVLGGAWSVLVAPVIGGGAPLGALELVDPLDGSCFDDRASPPLATPRRGSWTSFAARRRASGESSRPPPSEHRDVPARSPFPRLLAAGCIAARAWILLSALHRLALTLRQRPAPVAQLDRAALS